MPYKLVFNLLIFFNQVAKICHLNYTLCFYVRKLATLTEIMIASTLCVNYIHCVKHFISISYDLIITNYK